MSGKEARPARRLLTVCVCVRDKERGKENKMDRRDCDVELLVVNAYLGGNLCLKLKKTYS